MESMSTVTDQFTEFTTRTQDAVTTAVRSWADTVRSVTGGQPTPPDVHGAVDRYFDVAQQVLDGQRVLVRTVLDAGTKVTETVTAHAVTITDTVTSKAAGAARAASEKVSGTAKS